MQQTPAILSLVESRYSLAAMLELVYLQQTLANLPPDRRSAIDVGTHRGEMTAALLDLGFRVLALEPQPQTHRQLTTRFPAHREAGLVEIVQCAASDRTGVATMLLGSASTVSTLEESWTQIAFPEEFIQPRQVRVPVAGVAELAAERGFLRPGFVKIDVEGHELPALRGLLRDHLSDAPPPIVMFEANQRFSAAAEDCLRLLASHGYTRFDIFIREGIAPIASERFAAPALPRAWFECDGKYFYANIIAYHSQLSDQSIPPGPAGFVAEYQMESARTLLGKLLELEATRPIEVHPIWADARRELRRYLLEEDWRGFLQHPVCRHMFYRGRWGTTQDIEHQALSASSFGRALLGKIQDPPLGSPRLSGRIAGLSTNLLGMLYYMMRVEALGWRDPKPLTGGLLGQIVERSDRPPCVVEVGGGYGAFAYVHAKADPEAAYAIVDLPEMLALQHYFLTQALPGHRIVVATEKRDVQMKPGQIVLAPAFLACPMPVKADLFFSTFGFSEMPRELQVKIEESRYFGARSIFLAGQYSTEAPDARLVSHDEVIGAARRHFDSVDVERFHCGDNYLLIGARRGVAA